MMENSTPLTRWSAFAGGIAAILCFMFVVAPWFKRFESVNTLTSYIQETGINASALYWSEVEITADAEQGARSTVTYLPTTKKPSVTLPNAKNQ